MTLSVKHFTLYLRTKVFRKKYPALFQAIVVPGFTRGITVLYKTQEIEN